METVTFFFYHFRRSLRRSEPRFSTRGRILYRSFVIALLEQLQTCNPLTKVELCWEPPAPRPRQVIWTYYWAIVPIKEEYLHLFGGFSYWACHICPSDLDLSVRQATHISLVLLSESELIAPLLGSSLSYTELFEPGQNVEVYSSNWLFLFLAAYLDAFFWETHSCTMVAHIVHYDLWSLSTLLPVIVLIASFSPQPLPSIYLHCVIHGSQPRGFHVVICLSQLDYMRYCSYYAFAEPLSFNTYET